MVVAPVRTALERGKINLSASGYQRANAGLQCPCLLLPAGQVWSSIRRYRQNSYLGACGKTRTQTNWNPLALYLHQHGLAIPGPIDTSEFR